MTIRAGALANPQDHYRDLSTSTSSSSGFTTTETVVDTLVVSLAAGKRYRLIWDSSFLSTVAADVVLHRIREDSVSGTGLQAYRIPLTAANVSFAAHLEAWFTATVSGEKTFVVTAVRSSGTGTITRFANATSPANFAIEAW